MARFSSDRPADGLLTGRYLLAIVAAGSLVLAGCGGGGSKNLASATSVISGPASTGGGDTSNPGASAKRARARLPGPPGPVGPGDIVRAIAEWDPLLQSGVPSGQCVPLLNSVKKLGRAAQNAGGGLYVALYQGIAEGCLGQIDPARSHLEQARRVGLGDDITADPTCNAQRLLVFGFDSYLNQQISPVCNSTTTTIEKPTPTTSKTTSTTAKSSTTTR